MSALDSAFTLEPGTQAQFAEDGFIHLRQVLDPAVLSAYGAEITRLTMELNTQHLPMEERSTYDRAFLQVMNLWTQSETVRAFVFGQRLARIAAELLGVKGVRLYHDQSLYKEPGGGVTPAHADQYYWPLASDRVVTAWIPLQPVPLDMGPLAFWKGSQRVAQGRNLGISDESEQAIPERMERLGIPLVEQPFGLGDVSFHLGWTFHRAGENRSQNPRSVMTVIYMDERMRLKPEWNAVEKNDADQWCPGAVPGGLASGPLNPVLWSGA
jgi:ectoine hydroxylase-related dioxygenase (phytanoyl-CoA dioxygenase family)